ncbi:phage tail tape measure protein [Bifidobacterium choerinum]|uniref:Phage tail tape measure protein n=2 Tax=Bifidobacterium choerinum TaxID=35760 RepID=A0A2D3D7D1_9BIFI|nr:phage tail tape measure protein [Bifidobacterium choerinum]
MAVNENIMVRLTANISDYSAKMQQASAQTERLATTIVKPTNRVRQFETAATKTGMAVGAMSLAFGVAGVKMFADFDEAMSEVKANTGATGDELDALKNAALDAGKSTVYNATQSAQAINELAKAGMSTADVLSGGLSGALNLAASDGMEVADAAELMSSTLAQFNLTGSDAGRVADALAAGAAAAQGSAADLGYALSQAGLVANSFGISMEETTGALALFANTGMIGSDAGTSLKSMLQRLANPSKEAAATLEELGINAYDASGEFVGLESLAGQLKSQMGGLTQEQRNAAMATIFGADAVRAANALYEAGADGVDEWTQTVSQSGVAAEMAAAKTDNLKGDMEQLSGAIETALIQTGSGANDALRDIVQSVTGVVDAFASLDDDTQQLIVKGGLLVGALAGVHKVFGDLKNSCSVFGESLGLAIDPVQRLSSALPQFKEGFKVAFGGAQTQIEAFGGAVSRSQSVMGGMRIAAGGVLDLLGGPWGIALGIAGTLLAGYAEKVQKAKARTQELEAAIESGADVSEKMVKQVQEVDYGWYDRWKSGVDNLSGALDKAGISMSEFVRAAQGDQGALDKINGVVDKWSKYDSDTKEFHLARLIKSDLSDLSGAYEDASEKADAAKKANEELAASADQTGDAAQDAAAGTDELAGAMDESQSAAEEYADALDDLIDSLFSLEAPTLTAAQAQVQLDQSIRETVAKLTKQGKVLDENGNYLEGMQEKGEEAKSALYDLAGQAQDTATKILEEGQATGDMEGATKRAGDALAGARDAFIEAAVAAGINRDKAAELADKFGLSRDKAEELKQGLEQLDQTHADPTVDADTDAANQKIDDTQLRLQSMPNGQFMVYGNNEQAMQALAEITGATIDPKTGTLMLNKDQYDIALAIANGATIDPKTGFLLGNDNDYWKHVAESNGWKIDPKTGYIYGNNGQAMKSVKQVQQQKINDKSFAITATGAAAVEQQIGRIQQMRIGDKSFTVKTYYTSQGEKVHGGTIPKASGGMVFGPGTGTSDSIPARLSNGEFVVRAAQARRFRGLLESINNGSYGDSQGYAHGGMVAAQASPAEPYVREVRDRAVAPQYSQYNTFNMRGAASPRTQSDIIAAKLRFVGSSMMGA